MSGDKKAEELLKRLSKNKKFKESVKKIRENFDIPTEGGFFTKDQCINWQFGLRTGNQDYIADDSEILKHEKMFTGAILDLLEYHKIPPTLLPLIENYVLNENEFPYTRSNYFACEVENPNHSGTSLSIEDYWKARHFKYVRLLIHENASKKDVRDFVAKNWEKIQHHIKPGRKDAKRIRGTTEDKRDDTIFKIYKQIREKIIPRQKGYIYSQISKILKNEHGIIVGTDNIRRIITEQKKIRGTARFK